MDNVTHTLVGWTLARAGLDRRVTYATATLLIASNAPDLDIITAFTGGSTAYLAAHRGVTHGPLGFLTLGGGTAVLVFLWGVLRRKLPAASSSRARWLLQLVGIAVAGVALHALMDLPTSYGTRLLSPFAGTWYALDWMPIIDLYLWAALVGALLLGRQSGKTTRWAQLALLFLVLDYGARASLHELALSDATALEANSGSAPCATRPTLVKHPALIEAPLAGPHACIQAAALPTFISPFAWRVIRQYPNGYELSDRNVLERGAPVASTWMPADTGPEIALARATHTGRIFLDFSRFPSSHVIERSPDEIVVRFVDVRFVDVGAHLDPAPHARAPFVVTVALDAKGQVLREQLGN